MKTSLVLVSAAAALATAVSFCCIARPAREPVTVKAHAEGTRVLGRLPVAFVPNVGQWEHAASWVARVGAMTVFLEEKGWTFTLVERTTAKGKEERVDVNENASARGVAVRMTFAGASAPELVAEDRLPGCHNYFLGNDASKWRSDVPLYASVQYRGLYPGVDVRAREHVGLFEYDVLLGADADLAPVEIVVEGADRLHVAAGGELVMTTALGPVHMPVPVSWEEAPDGTKQAIACRYELRGANSFGFVAPGRRSGWALAVDPGLVWSTFLGGASIDSLWTLAVDDQGAPTVGGETMSVDFPVTPGAFGPTHSGGNWDAYVTRLTASGASLVFSTFLGGSGPDGARAVHVDAQGETTIAGVTSSSDFPTTAGAFDTSFGGVSDGFVAKLAPTGSSLVYSTFLGGAGNDWPQAVAVDAQGEATVAGYTTSLNFPTTLGAFDQTYNGGSGDAFVTRLTAPGSGLVYSTFLGGSGDDVARDVVLDSQGSATVVGVTTSPAFPTTTGAYDTSYNGGSSDAFVTKLSSLGSSLVYSTFLGGLNQDSANAVELDAQGGALVTGETLSSDFPATPGAFDTSYNGTSTHGDAYVARLSPSGSTLGYATFLGGIDNDVATGLAVDASGRALVVGYTQSGNFPTTPGAFVPSFPGSGGAFVTQISPSGSSLVYSTLLGAISGWDVAIDRNGVATVAGLGSASFPVTAGAFDTSYNGGSSDAFILRLDMLPTGVAAFGSSSPGCNGQLAISVNSMPQVGNAVFALTCGNAAPNSVGLIAFTDARFLTPVTVFGVDVWIDPTVLLVTATVFSNPIGASEVPLPIPANPAVAGVRLFTQFVWFGPTSPTPCPPLGFSASNALDFTIQP